MRRKGRDYRVQQIVHASSVFGGDREDFSQAQAMKFAGERGLLVAVDFVDGQEERFAGLAQAADEFEVGGSEFGAAVDHEHNSGSFLQRDPRLAENFRGMNSLSSGMMPPVSTTRRSHPRHSESP